MTANWPRAFSVLLLALGPGAATGADESDEVNEADDSPVQWQVPVDTSGLKPDCFYVRDVSDFDVLNLQYLIVYAPNKRRAFLVFVAPPVVELRQAITIGFLGPDRICGRPGDRLLLGGGGLGRQTTVFDVWRLDEAATDRLLESRRDREKPTVEPAAESPGAEVETEIKPDDDTAEESAD